MYAEELEDPPALYLPGRSFWGKTAWAGEGHQGPNGPQPCFQGQRKWPVGCLKQSYTQPSTPATEVLRVSSDSLV